MPGVLDSPSDKPLVFTANSGACVCLQPAPLTDITHERINRFKIRHRIGLTVRTVGRYWTMFNFSWFHSVYFKVFNKLLIKMVYRSHQLIHSVSLLLQALPLI